MGRVAVGTGYVGKRKVCPRLQRGAYSVVNKSRQESSERCVAEPGDGKGSI